MSSVVHFNQEIFYSSSDTVVFCPFVEALCTNFYFLNINMTVFIAENLKVLNEDVRLWTDYSQPFHYIESYGYYCWVITFTCLFLSLRDPEPCNIIATTHSCLCKEICSLLSKWNTRMKYFWGTIPQSI